jgi:type I restriction enzyme S subunit
VSTTTISNIEIILPDLDAQKKIVNILDRAERLKELRQQANFETDKYLQAVFLEMFGDPAKNNKNWKTSKLRELIDVERKSSTPSEIRDGKNYVGLEHIESETGKIKSAVRVKRGELKSSKFQFDSNCILYGKLRPYLNKIALPDFSGICSTDILPLRPKEGRANKYFIAYLLKLPHYVSLATQQSTGANLPRLNPKNLQDFDVFLPPIKLQEEFATIVTKIEKVKMNQTESENEIDTLFNSLLQNSFNQLTV